jgi:hypothetical protein
MRINIIKYLALIAICFSVSAKEVDKPVTSEIIGSGIFDVNRTRTFSMDDSTLIYLDGNLINDTTFEIIGSGYKTAFTVLEDVNGSIDSGTVNALELITNLQGPVTSVSPLMVLEQPVLMTSDTVKAFQSKMQLDVLFSFSGYLSNNNSLKATRVMDNVSLTNWKIRGFASDIDANSFKIGLLEINLGGEQILNCNTGFNNGQHVEVIMASDAAYQAGVAIDTILSIECINLNLLSKKSSVLPSVIQGSINQTQGQDFWLDDVLVSTSVNTEYENGEKNFVDESINVEVQGVFDAQTSEIQADVVRFLDTRIAITFPIEPEDIDIGESITIQGVTFFKTPQTKASSILDNGIVAAMQIEIQGFIDSEGKAYISKVLDKGLVNFNEISLRGNINSVNNPLFSLLNFQIDVTDSLIINLGAGTIDVGTFFGLIDVGSQVEVKNATYDTLLDKITDGTVRIKALSTRNQAAQTKEIIGSGIIGGYVRATISSTGDTLFASGFE